MKLTILKVFAVACSLALTGFVPVLQAQEAHTQDRKPAKDTERVLTNAEVVKMVKAGVEEDAILASIRTSHCRFDLTPEAMVILHKDGVNEAILKAMLEADAAARKTAGAGKEVAKAAPNKKHPKLTPEQERLILAKLRAKHKQPGTMVKSTQKAEETDPKVAALKQQKQAVQSGQVASANGGPSGSQSTPHPGTPAVGGGASGGGTGSSNSGGGTLLGGNNQPGPGQSTPPTPSAGGTNGTNPGGGLLASGNSPSGSGKNTPPAGTPGATGGTGGNNPANNPTGGNTPPGGSTPSGGSSPSARGNQPSGQRTVGMASRTGMTTAMLSSAPVAAATPPPSAAPARSSMLANNSNMSIDPCVISNMGPVIKGLNSSGSYGPAVFSQDPNYNPFWVIGCRFGNTQGQAYLNSSTGQKIATLRVNSWTDTLIKVTIDPYLTDVFDQDNVTLVIVPPAGQAGQKGGFSFYALRKEVLLPSIPQSQVNLAGITDTGGFGVVGYLTSPYRGFGYDVAVQDGDETSAEIASANASMTVSGQGWTTGVDRNAFYRFGPGTDYFNFTQLKPGFGVSRFQIHQWTEPICASSVGIVVGDTTFYFDGTWNAQLNLAQQQIQVAWQEEHCHSSDVSQGSDSSDSAYALQVWVSGPAIAPNESPWQPGLK